MKKFLLLMITSIVLMSCSGSSVDLVIDNPTDYPVIVKVDTLSVEIPANEVVWVEMGKGEHQITLEDNSVTKFNFTESRYMLNPTKSEYLKTEEYYGTSSANSLAMATAKNKKVEFLGIPLEGNYEVVKDLIVPITWDYGPREALPEMIEMDSDSATLTKLYESKEFIKMIEAEMASMTDEATENSGSETGTTEQPIEEVLIEAPKSE